MRGKWKYVLLVFALLILGAGGYGVYVFKFKEYDVADPELDEIVEDPYVVTLPDGTQLVIDKDGEIIEEIKPSSDEPTDEENMDTGDETKGDTTDEERERIEQSEEGELAGEPANESAEEQPAPKPTVAQIKQKYMPTIKDLETQANNNLDSLIGKAFSEYQAKKKNGEKISFGYFYNKYMNAALQLESSTDAVFNSIVTIVEKDLEENGFDKGHAQSLRDEYEAAKEARRSSLLNKAKEFL